MEIRFFCLQSEQGNQFDWKIVNIVKTSIGKKGGKKKNSYHFQLVS